MPDDVAARGERRIRRPLYPAAGTLPGEPVHDQGRGHASGLPQPVVAQLVPRTWTAAGWMYTPGQLRYAVSLAESMRSRQRPPAAAPAETG